MPSKEFSKILSFIKTCILVKQIGDYEVTNKIVIQAFKESDTEANGHLGTFPNII